MIRWKRMLEYLDREKGVLHAEKDPEQEYGGVSVLIDAAQCELDNQLCFARRSTFTDGFVDPEQLPASMSLVLQFDSEEDMNENTALLEQAATLKNCLIYTGNEDFQTAYFTLNKLFSIHARMHTAMMDMSQMIAKNKGLQALTDYLAGLYRCPVQVVDNAFSIRAFSLNYYRGTLLEQAETRHHLLNAEIITSLREKGYLHHLQTSREPIDIFLYGERQHAVSVFASNIKISSLALFDTENRIDPMMLDYLPDIANLFSLELAKDTVPGLNKYNDISYIFSYLLQNSEISIQTIRTRLLMFNYQLKPDMNLIYVDIQRSSILPTRIRSTAEQLRKLFSNSCYAIHNEGIIFLVSRDLRDAISDTEISDWTNTLEAVHYCIGISSTFQDFSRFSLHYEEAKSACRIGNRLYPKKTIHRYDDLRLSHIADKLKQENGDIFLYPPLMRLLAYDKEKGTELAHTLFCYLSHPKEINAICQKLFIHKNTLFYRMNKIRTIMGSDLYDAEEIALIFLSFELLKQEGKFSV